jgi:hypothetical protein
MMGKQSKRHAKDYLMGWPKTLCIAKAAEPRRGGQYARSNRSATEQAGNIQPISPRIAR